MAAKVGPRNERPQAWALTERKADGRVQPLLVCDDEPLVYDMVMDLRRRGCNVDAIEVTDTTLEPSWR